MSKRYYLGIDTSNYTTSVAISDSDGTVVANLKAPLAVKEGERGLRQSDAVFSHVKNFPILAERIREYVKDGEIAAIGYSATPRDIDGSYMPCFLVGEAVASMLSVTLGVPAYRFSHQAGHIMAASYSAGAGSVTNRPFLAFHVSGGTTDVVKAEPKDDGTFRCEPIGSGADLHAGQAIDRIGVRLGLPFPCGPALEKLAAEYKGKLPKTKICVDGLNCHLSGLENLAYKMYDERKDASSVAAFTLDFIGRTLVAMTENLRASYPGMPIVYGGGVMSNRILQRMLSDTFDQAFFAEPAYSADNAAGIALLTGRKAENIGGE